MQLFTFLFLFSCGTGFSAQQSGQSSYNCEQKSINVTLLSNSITWSWSKTDKELSYFLYANESYNVDNGTVSGSNKTLDNLTYGTEYVFVVIGKETNQSICNETFIISQLNLHVPQNVKLDIINASSVIISWNLSKFNDIEYIVTRSDRKEFSTKKNFKLIVDLLECKQYCFNVTAKKGSVKSAPSPNTCNITVPKEVAVPKINKIDNEYSKKRNISWTHGSSVQPDCFLSFELQYKKSSDLKYGVPIKKNKTFHYFTDLDLDENYFIKVRSVVNSLWGNSTFGNFSTVAEFYTTTKPILPTNVIVEPVSDTKLNVSWHYNGDPPNFLITVIKPNDKINRTTSNTSLIFDNLQPCTNYCFTIFASTKLGKSNETEKTCNNTFRSDFGVVTLGPIPNGIKKEVNISLAFNYIQQCNDFINIIYNGTNEKEQTSSTNQKQLTISNLTVNRVYQVKAMPTSSFKTKSNATGIYSSPQWFFTGNDKPKISGGSINNSWFYKVLNVSWVTSGDDFSAIHLYHIDVMRGGYCIRKILTCTSCVVEKLPAYSNDFNKSKCKEVRENITKFQQQISTSVSLNDLVGNLSVVITASNPVGMHKIYSSEFTNVPNKPGPPHQVKVSMSKMVDMDMDLSWASCNVSDTFGPSESFFVRQINRTIADIRTNETNISVSSLKHCSLYCFQIYASNAQGNSEPSNTVCNWTVSEDIKVVNVADIPSGKMNTVNVTWNYPDKENCIDHYELILSTRNSSPHPYKTNDKHLLLNLMRNQVYAVKVKGISKTKTKDNQNEGNFSEEKEFYTGNIIPKIFNVQPTYSWTRNMATVKWTVEESDINAVNSYVVKMLHYNGSCNFQVNVTCSSCYQYKLKTFKNEIESSCAVISVINETFKKDMKVSMNLKASAKYFLELYAGNAVGVHKVQNISISTMPNKPGIPTDITVLGARNYSIDISWTPASASDTIGPSNRFVVTLLNKTEVRNISTSTTKFISLEPCVSHCFNVFAYNDQGSSNVSDTACSITKSPDVGTVSQFHSFSSSLQQKNITWEYPKSCGITFLVEYKINNGSWNLHKTKYENFPMNASKKNKVYSVRVRAQSAYPTDNGNMDGPWSEEIKFYTGQNKPNIKVTKDRFDVSNDKLSLEFSVNGTQKDGIISYTVMITDASDNCILRLKCSCLQCLDDREDQKWFNAKQAHFFAKTNCSNFVEFNLTNDDKTCSLEFPLKTKTFQNNYTVVVFASNWLAFYSIHKKTHPMSNTNIPAIVIPLVLILFLFVLVVFVYVRRHQLQSFQFVRLQAWKNRKTTNSTDFDDETNSIPMKRLIEMNAPNSRSNNKDAVAVKPTGPPQLKDINIFLDGLKITRHEIKSFATYFENVSRNNATDLITEYKHLSTETANMEKFMGLTKFMGKSPYNLKKNRFINILPFDQTRVTLSSRSSTETYINASYIPNMADINKVDYIASQGPIETTLNDFILMIWEQKVSCIVMLTRTYEEGKFKCLQYWPNDVGSSLTFGTKKDFKITLKSEKEEPSHFERELSLTFKNSADERKIRMLHMHKWFDHSAPNLSEFYATLIRFQELVETTVNPPFLIHCSAGVGRTGTFICLDQIVKQLMRGQQYVDVFREVLKLRSYRNFIVQRHAQYVFVHEFLDFFIKKSYSEDRFPTSGII